MDIHDAALVGIDPARLAFLAKSIERDVDSRTCDGGVIIVSRHGKTVLHEAIGMTDRARGRAAPTHDVFPIMSLTKPLLCRFRAMSTERGQSSSTRVLRLLE